MPAVNFQARFVGAVEYGWKRQTIRAARKRPMRRGDRLYLYAGLRTQGARLLKTVKCRSVQDIEIVLDGPRMGIWLDGHRLGPGERLTLARADGFSTVNELVEFFKKTHGLAPGRPFKAQVIRW